MADRQTTGGYPKIGQVISADLSSLAQLQPGSTIQFMEDHIEEAVNGVIKERTNHQMKLKMAIHFKAMY